MVQGLPAVKWTPENNHKLLQVLVVIHAGTPDYKKIASVFGKSLSLMSSLIIQRPCARKRQHTTFRIR